MGAPETGGYESGYPHIGYDVAAQNEQLAGVFGDRLDHSHDRLHADPLASEETHSDAYTGGDAGRMVLDGYGNVDPVDQEPVGEGTADLIAIPDNEGTSPQFNDLDSYARALTVTVEGSATAEEVKLHAPQAISDLLGKASSERYQSNYQEVMTPWRIPEEGDDVYDMPPDMPRFFDLRLEGNTEVAPHLNEDSVRTASFTANAEGPQADRVAAEPLLDQVANQAASLAANAERLGVDEATVTSLQELAAANGEGRLNEWTALYVAQVVGHGQKPIESRITNPSQWAGLMPLLEHVQAQAPESPFTAMVRDGLINELETAIDAIANNPQATAGANFKLQNLAQGLIIVQSTMPVTETGQ